VESVRGDWLREVIVNHVIYIRYCDILLFELRAVDSRIIQAPSATYAIYLRLLAAL